MPHIRDPSTGLCVVCDRGKKPNPLIKKGFNDRKFCSRKQLESFKVDQDENTKKVNKTENQILKVTLLFNLIVFPKVIIGHDCGP